MRVGIGESEREFVRGQDLILADGDLLLNVSSSKVHIVFLGTLCRRELVNGTGRFRYSSWKVLGNCRDLREYSSMVHYMGFQTCADCIKGLRRLGTTRLKSEQEFIG